MPPPIGADPPIAVGFVSDEALGATFGLAARGPFNGRLHQRFEDDPFMARSGSQDEGQGPTVAVGADLDFGAEAALTTAQRLPFSAAVGRPCRVWMGTDQRPIDGMDCPIQLALLVGLLLQNGQNSWPDPGCLPAIEAAGHTRPLALPFGQVAPRRARAVNP